MYWILFDRTGIGRLYALSYLYYVPLGATITVVVALMVSFLPGQLYAGLDQKYAYHDTQVWTKNWLSLSICNNYIDLTLPTFLQLLNTRYIARLYKTVQNKTTS